MFESTAMQFLPFPKEKESNRHMYHKTLNKSKYGLRSMALSVMAMWCSHFNVMIFCAYFNTHPRARCALWWPLTAPPTNSTLTSFHPRPTKKKASDGAMSPKMASKLQAVCLCALVGFVEDAGENPRLLWLTSKVEKGGEGTWDTSFAIVGKTIPNLTLPSLLLNKLKEK